MQSPTSTSVATSHIAIHDRAGRVSWEIDAAGYLTGYERDGFGDVLTLTRFAKQISTAGLDLATVGPESIKGMLQPNTAQDRAIRYTYDAKGRVLTASEPAVSIYDRFNTNGMIDQEASRTSAYEYDAFGTVYRQSVYGVNALGQVVTEAAVTRFYYNARGEKTARIDILNDVIGKRRGYLTTFAYDASGNLKEQVEYEDAFGTWTDTTFAVNNAAANRKIAYEYDALNRKRVETRVDVTFTQNTIDLATSRGNIVTSYEYDALGNQTIVTDATGGRAYTYYDVLGRTTATARRQERDSGTIKADAGARITVYKHDIHGNIVLAIDYADLGTAGDRYFEVSEQMERSASNRVTASRYDLWGHAVETMDAVQFATDRKTARTSYDIFGRTAKTWRTASWTEVTAGWELKTHVQVAYQINRYDVLGRVVEVTQPGNSAMITAGGIDLDAVPAPETRHRFAFNAFGELESRTIYSGNNAVRMEETRYDQAGRAWLTNAKDGVYRVSLFDVRGNATASFTSFAQATEGQPSTLSLLKRAHDVLGRYDTSRIDTRYDMLGHVTDTSTPYGRQLYFLQRSDTRLWEKVPYDPSKPITDGLVVVGDRSETTSNYGAKYRLKGSTEWITSSPRLQRVDGYPVFNTGGLPQGDYEIVVTLHDPATNETYELEGGYLSVSVATSTQKPLDILSLYVALLGRAPDPEGRLLPGSAE